MSSTVFFADGSSELATLSNSFLVGGVLTDPTVTTLTVTDPTGAATAPAVTHVSTGKFSATVPCTLPGVWIYRWTGTGAATDVVVGTWTVGAVDNSFYCTSEELKSRLGITDASDDFEILLAVGAACRGIDGITGRYFWRGTDTRTYVPESPYGQELDDLVSVTSFKVDRDGDGIFEETWTAGTDYALTVSPGRYNAAARGEQWPYTGFTVTGSKLIPLAWPLSRQDRIQVMGPFGWPAVPATVKQASLIAGAQLFRLKDAAFGVAGFGDLGVVRIQQMPQVMWMLKRYCSGERVGV